MTNDNNKIKELVSDDDDPTAELEVLTLKPEESFDDADEDRESDAHTFDFADVDEDRDPQQDSISALQSDLKTRSRTIGRLQYDIEQLRAKWLGLETEIKAREEIARNLNQEAGELRDRLAGKEKLLKKRNQTIRTLKADLRKGEEDQNALAEQYGDVERALDEQRVIEAQNLEALGDAARDFKKLQSEFDGERSDANRLRSQLEKLEAEIESRKEESQGLTRELQEVRKNVAHKSELLTKRDQTIRALTDEIQQRDEKQRSLENQLDEVEQQLREQRAAEKDYLAALEVAARDLSDLQMELDNTRVEAERDAEYISNRQKATDRELLGRVSRTETYADVLRHKLQDLIEQNEALRKGHENKVQALQEKALENEELTQRLESTQDAIAELAQKLEENQQSHEEEIRIVRFELGEAQNTAAEADDQSTQLASELLVSHSARDELKQALSNREEQAQMRIEQLERDLRKLSRLTEDYERRLDTKSEAINALMMELSKKAAQFDSINELEDVIHDLDDRMSERIDDSVDEAELKHDPQPAQSDRERTTRLLIGNIDNQELRFPLFKDRLTIGRADDNDIQLRASCVSRRHAVILTERDKTRVIDWGSKNGVFVNSKRVKERFLSNGDVVLIGTGQFHYEERPKRDA